MKAVFVLNLTIAIGFFLLSCNKEFVPSLEVDNSLPQSINLVDPYGDLTEMSNESSRRTLFKNLDKESQVLYIKVRLKEVLDNMKLNDTQFSTINLLINNIDSLYTGSRESIVQFEQKALPLFGEELYSFIFTTFQPINQSVFNDNLVVKGDDCCSTKSDYCNSKQDCKLYASCWQTYACGTLYLYHCDGKCFDVVIPPPTDPVD